MIVVKSKSWNPETGQKEKDDERLVSLGPIKPTRHLEDAQGREARNYGNLRSQCALVKRFMGQAPATGQYRLVNVRCKRWSCPYCRERNRKQLIAKIINGEPQRFITLTTAVTVRETPLDCLHRTRPLVTRLMSKVRRRFGRLEYALIVEWTKKGWPHYHLLTKGAYVPKNWLSKEWMKLSGAFIVDIRQIHDQKKAACYVAKYTTKAIETRPFGVSIRSFAFTRAYLIPKQSNPTKAEFFYERTYEQPAEVIARLQLSHVITPKPWGWEFDPIIPPNSS